MKDRLQALRKRLQAWLQSLWSRFPLKYIIRVWMRLPASTRALPIHLFRAIRDFQDYGLRQAAALSYYAIFSVFPLVLLLTIGVNSVVGSAVAQEQITQALILFLPDEAGTIDFVQRGVEQALEQSQSFTLVALVGLLWSGLGLFSNLTSSLDRIFQAPATRSIWRQRAIAFLMTFVLILLVVVSFITSGLLWLVNTLFITTPNIWIRISTFFLPYGISILIFALLFRYVPSRHVNWDAIWPAAILGGVALELAKVGFAWYLDSLTNFTPIYGSIATAIVLLLWAYLIAAIFLISAEICSQLNLWFMGHNDERVRVISESILTHLPADMPPPI
ncbi:MAG: hypothetical protein OHK0046_00670 [Anaerolineae bacterium]